MGGKPQTSPTSRLLRGAAVLGAAAVISKLLGTLQKIPLQNIAGDGAFGIYNTVYPLYILILMLATAGFPIAVSKFVSERAVRGNDEEAGRVLRICSVILMVTSGLFFAVLFFGAERIAGWMGNRHTVSAIRSVSFALLFVPIMAALRGYFQGYQNMVPTAISQVMEQLVRVGTMIALLLYFTHSGYSDGTIAAGATFGSVTGAVAGLAVMIYYWRRDGKGKRVFVSRPEYDSLSNPSKVAAPRESAFQLSKLFIAYALPVCLGTIVMPILNLVDSFTMPRMLSHIGLSESEAMDRFGVYGRGMPLIQLVSMIATSMSVALIPAISEAKARGQWSVIKLRTELSMRLTWLVGLAASVGMAAAAVPLNVMFYTNGSGSGAMAILAFTALFSTLNVVSGSLLQGLGSVIVPARNLLIAAGLKVVLNIMFIPWWGIEGAAFAAVIAYGAACILNIVSLRKITKASFSWTHYIIKPGLAMLAMTVSIVCIIQGAEWILSPLSMSYRIKETIVALLAVCVGAAVFGAALFRVGAVDKDDLAYVPSFSSRMMPLLQKLRLIHS